MGRPVEVAGPPDSQAALREGALWPDWAAPAGVVGLMSGRAGGVSAAPFDTLNLRPPGLRGDAVDAAAAVFENQRRFAAALGATPIYLDQVHGADVVRLTAADAAPGVGFHRADASISTEAGIACTVLVADCLPVLFCSADGQAVGAAHAGWRGLAAGVLDNTVAALCAATGCQPAALHAWLGACIGPAAFEVGADVLAAFGVDSTPVSTPRFRWQPRADGQPRWRADLAGLARDRLLAIGLQQLSGGGWCTVDGASRFFSFRRERITGRMAAAVARRG